MRMPVYGITGFVSAISTSWAPSLVSASMVPDLCHTVAMFPFARSLGSLLRKTKAPLATTTCGDLTEKAIASLVLPNSRSECHVFQRRCQPTPPRVVHVFLSRRRMNHMTSMCRTLANSPLLYIATFPLCRSVCGVSNEQRGV